MSSYTFILLIDGAVLQTQPTDTLCIAKKSTTFTNDYQLEHCWSQIVNDSFTTVFQDAAIKPKRAGQKVLLTSSTFDWEDNYRVFATAKYKHGMLVSSIPKYTWEFSILTPLVQVSSATNNQQLAFGQKTSYSNNIFTPALTASATEFLNPSGPQSPDDSFLANTIPNTLHIAVELQAGGTWVPVYVDPDTHTGEMNHQLTPLNEVRSTIG